QELHRAALVLPRLVPRPRACLRSIERVDRRRIASSFAIAIAHDRDCRVPQIFRRSAPVEVANIARAEAPGENALESPIRRFRRSNAAVLLANDTHDGR